MVREITDQYGRNDSYEICKQGSMPFCRTLSTSDGYMLENSSCNAKIRRCIDGQCA
jgi:hypothetical protein